MLVAKIFIVNKLMAEILDMGSRILGKFLWWGLNRSFQNMKVADK